MFDHQKTVTRIIIQGHSNTPQHNSVVHQQRAEQHSEVYSQCEYHSAVRQRGLVIHVAIVPKSHNTILNGRSQTQTRSSFLM